MNCLRRTLLSSRHFCILHQYLSTINTKSGEKLCNASQEQYLNSIDCNLFSTYSVLKNNRPTESWSLEQNQSFGKEITNEEEPLIDILNRVELSNDDLINSFKNLSYAFKMRKNKSVAYMEKDLVKFVSSDKFLNFCNELEKNVHLFTPPDFIILLKLKLFRIPPTNSLMQKIYSCIIEKIHSFTVAEALHVYNEVFGPIFEESNEVKVLKFVCLQYVEHHFKHPAYLDYNSLAIFCNTQRLPRHIRKKILSLFVFNFSAVGPKLNVESICRLFGTFIDKRLLFLYKPELWLEAKKKLNQDVSLHLFVDCLTGIKNLVREGIIQDESVVNNMVEFSMNKNYNELSISSICQRFYQMEHKCLPLIRHLEELYAKAKYVTVYSFGTTLAKTLAAIYYHPFGYTGDDEIHKECLRKLETINFKRCSSIMFMDWCLSITALGLSKRFDYVNEYFKQVMENPRELTSPICESILTLNTFMRQNFPNEVMELPEEFLQQCFKFIRIKTANDLILNAFKSFIPMDTEYYDFCTTSTHQFICLATVFRSGNKDNSCEKMYIPGSAQNVEKIKLSPSSKLVLYMIYDGDFPCDFRNCSELPGLMKLRKDTFRNINAEVIYFHSKVLTGLDKTGFAKYIYGKTSHLR